MKKHSNRTIYPTSTTAYGRFLRLAVVTATAVYCPLAMAEEITGNATHGKVTITAANAKEGLVAVGYYHVDNTTATGGNVIVEDTGTKTLNMVVGGGSEEGEAKNNHVTVKKGKIQTINGGGGLLGSTDNTVTIKGGEIKDIVGGFSNYEGVAQNNRVTIYDGSIGYVWAGNSYADPSLTNNSTASGNKIVIHGGKILGVDSQGYDRNSVIAAVAQHADAKNNEVVIEGGEITGTIYGAESVGSHGKSAVNNRVIIKGGTILWRKKALVAGGGARGQVKQNKVTITAGTIKLNVYGGYGINDYSEKDKPLVSDNHVTMSGGKLLGFVALVGGSSPKGIAQNNTTTISGNAVAAIALGGMTDSGTVQGNQVTMNGGKVFFAYGGLSDETGLIDNNTVTINGGIIDFGVVGGDSTKGTVKNNTVNINGGTYKQNVTLYGCGYVSKNCSNNTINIKVPTLAIDDGKRGIRNIEKVDNLYFYLPKDIKKTTPIVTLTQDVNGGTDLTKTRIGVRALSGLTLKVGDEIILIKAAILKTAATLKNQTAQMKDGLSTYQFSLRNKNNQLIAKVTKIIKTGRIFADSFEK